MHRWGDNTVDWDGIEGAVELISSFSRRWGRLGGQSKEKYGTVRFYAIFGNLSLHTLIYPGYAYNQFPKWLWVFDLCYIGPFLNAVVGGMFTRWQVVVYRKAYQKAIKKWPHLRDEILSAADYEEFLEGL